MPSIEMRARHANAAQTNADFYSAEQTVRLLQLVVLGYLFANRYLKCLHIRIDRRIGKEDIKVRLVEQVTKGFRPSS